MNRAFSVDKPIILRTPVPGVFSAINLSGLLLANMTTFGDGCFAMPALLASLPTERPTHEATL